MRRLVAVAAMLVLVAAVAILWRPLSGLAAPEPRVALVIGNANFGPDIGRLKNPVNDARLMAATLTKVGFETKIVYDVNRATMLRAIAEFGVRLRRAGPDAVGVFYYAGHGFQFNGRNWLVPIGANIGNEADADIEAVPADYVLGQMSVARNRLNILILDACRNNPFTRGFRDTTQRGLTAMQAPRGSFIAFATEPGGVAADGQGDNSPFAQALATEIGSSTEPVEIVFRKVRQRVQTVTGGKQTPYDNSSVSEDFRFTKPGAAAGPVRPAPPTGSGPGPSTSRAPVSQDELELEAWRNLGPNPTKEELEAFLQAFPNGKYAGLARARLNRLKQEAAKPQGPATQPQGPPPSSAGVPVAGTPQPGQSFRDCTECPEMVVVPAGRFVMGDNPNDSAHDSDALPQHSVSISRDFAVGKFEVTFAEWDACVAARGCGGHRPEDRGWGRGRQPAMNVSWDDAQAYVNWLSNRSGKRYRLLTEAEWEYAARAGTTTAYPWGSQANHEYANYGKDDCCGGLAQGRDRWADQTAPVGSFPSNRFGLFDMHGNVWEWVEDCWNANYNGAPSDGRAWTSGDCSRRVLRGGSWYDGPQDLRSALRVRYTTTLRNDGNGFRVARTL